MYSALSDIVQFDVIIYKLEHRRSKRIGSEGSVYYKINGLSKYINGELCTDWNIFSLKFVRMADVSVWGGGSFNINYPLRNKHL